MLTKHQKLLTNFSGLILVTGLMAMDLISPSLPYIMHALNASAINTKLLIVVYMIGLGLSQFFYGTFADNYGRKKTMLVSYSISIIGVLVSLSAHSITTLIIGRFINGCGNGGATVIARAVISDVCDTPVALKHAFACFSIFAMLSPSLAPVLGGFIQEYLHNWRFPFVALLIITVVSGLIVQRWMPETHAIPVVKKTGMQQSKLYAELFKLKNFMLYNFASALIHIFTIGYYAYMPFILFQLHISPLENGCLFALYALALLAGAVTFSKYLKTINSQTLFASCCWGFTVCVIIFYGYFNSYAAIEIIVLFSIAIAFLCGIAAPLTMALCMQGFAASNRGAASAVQGFMKMFFTGVALLFFNFIPLQAMTGLLLCFFILAVLLLALVFCSKQLCLVEERGLSSSEAQQ